MAFRHRLSAGAWMPRRLITKLRGELLPEWIAAVRADDLPGLMSCADGLQSDLDAVAAGLTTTWNSTTIHITPATARHTSIIAPTATPMLRPHVIEKAIPRTEA